MNPTANQDTVLNVSGISKRFGGLQALSDVGITIQRGQVYVLRDGKPYRIGIGIGVSDGSVTQAFSTAFKQGDVVITGGGPQPKT